MASLLNSLYASCRMNDLRSQFFAFTFLFFFTGCAQLAKAPQKDHKALVKGICLNAEGRGRIGVGGPSQSFEYESLFDEEAGSFVMVSRFGVGHKYSFKSYWNAFEKKVLVETDFMEAIEDKRDRESMGTVIDAWAEFFSYILSHTPSFSAQQDLESEKSAFKVEWKEHDTLIESEKTTIELRNFHQKGYYETMDVETRFDSLSRKSKLEMIITRCFLSENK